MGGSGAEALDDDTRSGRFRLVAMRTRDLLSIKMKGNGAAPLNHRHYTAHHRSPEYHLNVLHQQNLSPLGSATEPAKFYSVFRQKASVKLR